MADKLSIIIPSYNEESNISFIYNEISIFLNKLKYEIIFINDGSSDETFKEIKKITKEDKKVKGVSLSRNFGHQIALLAGLKEAKNDIIIMMDADGQHPAELIPSMLEKHKEGFDIVNTKRNSTKGIGYFKRTSSKFYYRFLNAITDIKVEYDSSDFRLMSRKAVDAFIEMEEQNRFTRGMISWMGFKQAFIEYDAPMRNSGKTKYTFRKMLHFGADGVTSFSSKPLKMSFYLGLVSLLIGFSYGIYALVVYFSGNAVPGWTSLLLIILFIGGVQLLGIGILGEYLSKIFNEIKKRPHYFIDDRCGEY